MKVKSILISLLIMILVSGCTDKLGKIDFSGQIELEPDSGGWAYRNIASAKVRPVKVDPDDQLGDYQNDLELHKAITIGKGEYVIATKFKTNHLSTGHDILDIFLKSDFFNVFGDYRILVYNLEGKAKVDTIVAKDSETGDDWGSLIDDTRANIETRKLERKGEFIQYFREPETKRDCIIEVGYEIESKATRKIDKDEEFVEEDGGYKYEELSVEGSAWINIGYRQCLTGKRVIGDEVIRFYILDWDLDGEFTEKDMVWSDYTNKTYGFGQVVRLTDSWSAKKDNTYRLKLIKPKSDNDKFILEIELEAKGKG